MRTAVAVVSYLCVDEGLGVRQRMHGPGACRFEGEGSFVSKATALLSGTETITAIVTVLVTHYMQVSFFYAKLSFILTV